MRRKEQRCCEEGAGQGEVRGFNSCNVFTPPVQIGPSQLLFDFNQTINDKQRVFVIRSLPRSLRRTSLTCRSITM